MVFAKRKQPEPAPAPDLAGEVLKLRGMIRAFIDAKVDEVERSQSGSGLPAESIRMMLCRGDDCFCRICMNLLAEESNG